MELDQRQTLILAILVLFLGRWLNRHCGRFANGTFPSR
jgi:Na+/glutamate symporter